MLANISKAFFSQNVVLDPKFKPDARVLNICITSKATELHPLKTFRLNLWKEERDVVKKITLADRL